MKTPARRRTNKYFAALSGMFVIAALVVLPSVQSRQLARTAIANPGNHSSEVPESKIATSLGRWNWMPNLAAPALVETVEVLAADCLTPKTSFIVGETVCAKTDGVDLTVPANHYMNWIDSQNAATNGGTITQNPQYFLFVPQTADTWKATVGSVVPDDSSVIANPPLFTVSEGPAISTYDATCTTPKTSFVLGETVCAKASGVAVNTSFPNRISWSDAEGFIRESADITADPQTDTFTLPATQTSVIGGTTVDNRGTWRANFTRSSGRSIAVAPFTVSDPLLPAADVSVQKFQRDANTQIYSGNNVAFIILVQNNGPDKANSVNLIDSLPSGATLASFNQDSGPQCLPVNNQNCTIAEMTKGERAQFTAIYTVSGAAGTRTTSASVSTTTPDPDSSNNTATAEFTVQPGSPAGDCSLTCPDNIVAFANTTENGERGAHVTYAEPEGVGTCGSITSTPASGSFFAVGQHTVTATSETGGGTCQFEITVEEPTGNVSISCPANKEDIADGDCETPVAVGTPTTSGDNVTLFATRSDGRPMYDCDANGTNCTRRSPDETFQAGTTIITWIAYSHSAPGPYADADDEESKRTGSASCTQTVVITDVTAPVIAAVDQTIAADANCQAVVPNYISTVSDNCACASSDTSQACEDRTDFTYTQTPDAGTVVVPGEYEVTITANDGSSNNDGAGNETTKTITLTVEDTTAPTVTAPADSSASADANCQAPVPDYTANSTATDNCDTSLTITQDPAPGTMVSGSGPHTVTVSTTDDAGNTGSDTVIFTVNDVTAPAITAPPDSSASADNNCLAPVPDYTATSSTSDNCDSSLTVTQSPEAGTMVGKGSHTVTVTATDDAGNSSGDTVVFTVNDTTAPVISCPANITTNTAPGTCSAAVVPGTATATDNCDGTPNITGTRSDGQPLVALYPKGTTTITWRATDDDGNYSECNQTVTVVDNEAPVITFNGQTPSMWPPNHNYRNFTNADFISSVSDNCDSLSVNDVYITKVTSDEAEESLTLGDGATFNDMVIAADCKSVQLRAERVNSGNGRVYTIHFKVVDSSGNVTTGTAKVHSPKNQNNGTVDDGPVYTVTSTCP